MDNIQRLLNQIKVHDCSLTKIRIGNNHDGGYIAAKELCKKTGAVYCYGIGSDISFELHFINKFPDTNKILLYDHTIDELPVNHPKFEFFKQGIGNGYGNIKDVENNSLLKIDVEWNEWDVLKNIDIKILNKFSQILIEIHLVNAEMKDSLSPYFKHFYEMALKKINNNLFKSYYDAMKKLTGSFYIFHLHANNSLPKISVDGYDFPPLIELSLVRKGLIENATETTSSFPIEGLDYPNKTDRADITNPYPLGS